MLDSIQTNLSVSHARYADRCGRARTALPAVTVIHSAPSLACCLGAAIQPRTALLLAAPPPAVLTLEILAPLPPRTTQLCVLLDDGQHVHLPARGGRGRRRRAAGHPQEDVQRRGHRSAAGLPEKGERAAGGGGAGGGRPTLCARKYLSACGTSVPGSGAKQRQPTCGPCCCCRRASVDRTSCCRRRLQPHAALSTALRCSMGADP